LTGQVLIRTPGAASDAVSHWLEKDGDVAYYEPNEILPLSRTPNDPSLGQLWGLNNTGQTINGQAGTRDADIDAPEAWDLSTGSASIVVGVIDTGIDYSHPDLAANIWTNPGEVAGNGIDDDGNGFVDDVHGYDFVNNDGDPFDDHGHGTHVAGTIGAAGDNQRGVSGVNWNTSLMALKFLSGTGSGSLSDAVRAINYATMMRSRYGVNVRVTNNSWGGGGYNQSLADAIGAQGQAGILFVAAAGNSGTNNDQSPNYPASYNFDNVIAVAASDNRDNLASFSNYGATSVDLAAPGVSIYSTAPGGGYQTMSGTSMATPHVAGAAALAWAVNPTATVAQIRSALLNGVDRVTGLSGKVATGGRLNVRGTLDQLDMAVAAANPAPGSVLTTRPTEFTIDFTQDYSPASVQAADFTVNGVAANSVTLVDGNTIRFRFNSSPVANQGPQTMRIAEGAIGRAGGGGVRGWEATFYYDQVAMAVSATTPGENQTFAAAPSEIRIVFNEAVDPASVGVGDLTLSRGTVTAASLVNANTVRYAISVPAVEGQVTYTLAAGALRDSYGNASPAYVGHFTVDDPAVVRYEAANLPVAVPDQGTIVSRITINEQHTIRDLDVEISINHTWDEDLDVFLVAPNGTRIELFTDVGGNGQNFLNTTLDDQAATPIGSGRAPFSGRYRPEGSLAALNGLSTAGTWTLEVTDDYQYDTGALTAWALQFRVNLPPQMTPIADQTMARTTDAISVPLAATDPEGGNVTFSARAVSAAYGLDQKLGLWAEPGRIAANYYYNAYGRQEKWIRGGSDRFYCLLPNGELRRYDGSIDNLPLVATLDTSYYANPALLLDAVAGSPAATLTVDAQAGRLTINPHDGFAGDFFVEVAASDGSQTAYQFFRVSVTNAAPQLQPIADRTVSHRVDKIEVALTANDPEGDPLTYTATATAVVGNPLYDLDQQLNLWADPARIAANYYYNAYGRQEKWIRSGSDRFYCLLPNGELRRYDGSINNLPLVATLDSGVHADPARLLDAQPTQLTIPATVDASGKLTVDPPAGFTGDIRVQVSVSDGAARDSKSFTIHVVNQPATLAAVADQTMATGTDQLEVPLSVTNPDGDPLSFGVTAVSVGSRGYELDQQLNLWAEPARVAANYYCNYYGLGEKWIRSGSDRFYCLLPNGELRRLDGGRDRLTLVATLDSSYYNDPAKLWNPQAPAAIPATVDAAGKLTIDPPAGFTGDIRVTANVSDGISLDAKSFVVHVVPSLPLAAAQSAAAAGHASGVSAPTSPLPLTGEGQGVRALVSPLPQAGEGQGVRAGYAPTQPFQSTSLTTAPNLQTPSANYRTPKPLAAPLTLDVQRVRGQLSEMQTLQPMAKARLGADDGFQDLADRVFAKLEAIEAAVAHLDDPGDLVLARLAARRR
jgi:subtilisin family serine protease/subtilisin-like proprotein convertase family protein/nuclear transport factor 2 (NTF2) superfamily protein